MTEFITQVIQPPFTTVEIEIVRDEDWTTPLPAITGLGDITGMTIEIFVRPTYSHETLFKKLSTATGEITITDGPNGLAQINIWREDVIADFPSGNWVWFATINDGSNWFELWRGPFTVHDGNISV